METKVIKNWIKESTSLLILTYAMGLAFIIVWFVTKFCTDANYAIIVVSIYPIFTSLLIGSKFRSYFMFGFSRKQYFKNIIMLHFVLAAETAIINIVIIESILRLYSNNTMFNFKIALFMGATVFDKILYFFLYFCLLYGIVFLNEARNKFLPFTFAISIKSFLGTIIWMVIPVYINLIFELQITWDNILLKISIYFGFLIAIILIYYIAYKKMLKRELIWVHDEAKK